ncbi:MAG: hypothetical protein Q4Q20_03605 [Methanocorpusculum sp.]|nr:hypothetical protein [Methanocorpusculum sp.]
MLCVIRYKFDISAGLDDVALAMFLINAAVTVIELYLAFSVFAEKTKLPVF